jgi:hypothetical protein
MGSRHFKFERELVNRLVEEIENIVVAGRKQRF